MLNQLNPEETDKYLYVKKTPTWFIRAFYAFGIVAWFLVVYSYLGSIAVDPFFRYYVGPMLIFFTLYHVCTYGLAICYKRLDISKHERLVSEFWNSRAEPSVDVFLPICGEDIDILKNTWEYVSRIDYKNKHVYLLDDSKEGRDEHQHIAEQEYGFTYLSRSNRGEMKKAGNLKYGYERSGGDFIVIFDADFAPRHDFVHDLLPYMSDSKVGIVQSPQYFGMKREVHRRAPLEYGGAQVQEAFYRFIQVARDRFGGTICCGSNAIYRRAALDEIGGTVQIEHSEDAHTGFALTERGWIVRYVPIILAVGICPDNAHAYFHQQHRWCLGSMSLLTTKKFWVSPVPWKTKFCYVCGFLFYMSALISVLFSFQLFWTLFFYNQYINFENGLLYYPYMLWSFSYLLIFPIMRFRRGSFYASFVQSYAYGHAVITAFASRTVGWIPTNTKTATVSTAFKQATWAASIYVFVYFSLLALAVRTGTLHIFDLNYYSVQFWIFFNLVLSSMLLWKLYGAMEQAQIQRIENGQLTLAGLTEWKLKTGIPYVALLTATFLCIVYV